MAIPHQWRIARAGPRHRHRLRSILPAGLAALLMSFQVSPAAERPKFAAKAPTGFEALLRPQTNVVDVFFGGRRVGDALATFEPGTLRFADAKAVVTLLPATKDAAKVLAALTPTLSTH